MTTSTPEPAHVGRHAGPAKSNTQLLNFLERVGWTLLQAATAEGLLAAWEATGHEISPGSKAVYLIALTTLLAAAKNAAAQALGSPTGATLPSVSQPVPAEDVVTKLDNASATGVVAWTGASLPNDTPVVPPIESLAA